LCCHETPKSTRTNGKWGHVRYKLSPISFPPQDDALGPESDDDLVEDLAAAANDGDLRAMAPELGSILEADARSTTGD
jgi:hypothetical protein